GSSGAENLQLRPPAAAPIAQAGRSQHRTAGLPLPAHAGRTSHHRPAEPRALRRTAATAVAAGRFHAALRAAPACADPGPRGRALPAPRQPLEPGGLLPAPAVLVQPTVARRLAQVPPRPGNVLRRAGAATGRARRRKAVRKDAY